MYNHYGLWGYTQDVCPIGLDAKGSTVASSYTATERARVGWVTYIKASL